MSWYIGGTRIFVTDINNTYPQVITKLTPLVSGSVYHTFGYEFVETKLTGIIVGNIDNLFIRQMTRTGVPVALVTPYGNYGNFFVKNVSIKMQKSNCQSIRPDLPADSPVYLAEMELYLDE